MGCIFLMNTHSYIKHQYFMCKKKKKKKRHFVMRYVCIQVFSLPNYKTGLWLFVIYKECHTVHCSSRFIYIDIQIL